MPLSHNLDQLSPFDRAVMEHLSKRGIKITASKDHGDGTWSHEAEFQSGVLIFSKVAEAEQDKDA